MLLHKRSVFKDFELRYGIRRFTTLDRALRGSSWTNSSDSDWSQTLCLVPGLALFNDAQCDIVGTS